MDKSLQDKYAPHNECFGCGPSNPKGLRVKSFPNEQGQVVAQWKPELHHEAFPDVLNGGVIGAILDCHCNWTAAWKLMQENKLDSPPCTVTAQYTIKLQRPTPTHQMLKLIASIENIIDCKVEVTAELRDENNNLCATCDGVFVAVKPGHPAYHRW